MARRAATRAGQGDSTQRREPLCTGELCVHPIAVTRRRQVGRVRSPDGSATGPGQSSGRSLPCCPPCCRPRTPYNTRVRQRGAWASAAGPGRGGVRELYFQITTLCEWWPSLVAKPGGQPGGQRTPTPPADWTSHPLARTPRSLHPLPPSAVASTPDVSRAPRRPMARAERGMASQSLLRRQSVSVHHPVAETPRRPKAATRRAE